VLTFCDLTPCTPKKVGGSYGGSYASIFGWNSKQGKLKLAQLLASYWLFGKLVTSQKISFFMVTPETSSGPANSSSQLLCAEIAPGHSSHCGNAAGTLPGIGRDHLRHPSYIWTLCALTLTASQTGPQELGKNSSVSWDVNPFSPLKANPCFGGTCCLHLQGRIS
jgi:hypothetical protein